jgi:AcrR family transcriptional regulator
MSAVSRHRVSPSVAAPLARGRSLGVRVKRSVAVDRPADAVTPGRIVEIQRSRLLAAALGALDELGYGSTTVTDVTSRARVSRRTFYEFFADREECLAAALEDALALVREELERAGLEGLGWRERVRTGLSVILAFFEREPVLARVCVVQALRGGPGVLARREQVLASLVAVVDEGRLESARGGECSALTAEGLVGAAFAIVYARLLRRERQPLSGLLGELMAMIVLPYLGPAAARREQARPAPARLTGISPAAATTATGVGVGSDPLEGVAMRLTYRTARVLHGVAEMGRRGSSPSNREVGECAGISDAGQVSKLLARLERLGLLSNTSGGHARGEPNAWSLTPKGERVTGSIHAHTLRTGDRIGRRTRDRIGREAA